jgi:hypothetical protein
MLLLLRGCGRCWRGGGNGSLPSWPVSSFLYLQACQTKVPYPMTKQAGFDWHHRRAASNKQTYSTAIKACRVNPR